MNDSRFERAIEVIPTAAVKEVVKRRVHKDYIQSSMTHENRALFARCSVSGSKVPGEGRFLGVVEGGEEERESAHAVSSPPATAPFACNHVRRLAHIGGARVTPESFFVSPSFTSNATFI